ncbi:TIGR02677 family protein [Amycolatopsis orientalis]|uniref:TIGR02677 family protein n=1 Tax=Amycolatopsis orientalis TaxID=31958 RepID=A0A193BS74_AMYOR|nr:TIGR02677 family protein [Amycolatopsis orientalis]ANN15055.1 TIGR02677 family protein [Amycolatopsis orientalis]
MDPIRVPPEMFRFTDGSKSGLPLAILHVFGEANERLETALGIDDIRTRLRETGWLETLDDEDLAKALEQLRSQSHLDIVQNHAGDYRTASEYERRNLQYSLTRQGEAALAGIVRANEVLAGAGALQTATLDALGERLGELVRQLEDGTDRRVFSTLAEIESHLESFRDNTKRFNGDLQRLLRAEADLSTFHEVKASTVAYLQQFLNDLEHHTHTIATRVKEIDEYGVERVHRRALNGAALPGPDQRWLEVRKARWDGLRAWFLPEDGATPRVEDLHQVARRAIITLLQVLDRITESRRRASSAVADFRELARWFTVVPAQEDLHRLWSTMFGLSSARHAHLAHADPEVVSTTASWLDAPPVEVSELLRSAGRTERFTRTGRVRDVSAIRAARVRQAIAERAELEAAWSMLDTGGVVRLSAFEKLDHTVFERLLDLLGQALGSSPGTGGTRRSTTSDGQIEIILRPPHNGAVARLTTTSGVFRGPDYEIEISTAGGGA